METPPPGRERRGTLPNEDVAGAAHPLAPAPPPPFSQPPNPVFERRADPAAPGRGGLLELARQGLWRALAERARRGAEAGVAAQEATAWHVLALVRLRLYGAAADALRAAGDLDAATEPAPFALRLLAAELPHFLGHPAQALSELHALLERCDDPAVGGAGEEERRARRECVLGALSAHHLASKDYLGALRWLDRVLRDKPGCPAALSQVAYVQLQMGDVSGAETSFRLVEDGVGPDASDGLAALMRRNAGLIKFAKGDYAGAREEFHAALAVRPWDSVAVNNAALCHMYNRDLQGAIDLLEHHLQEDPLHHLDETLVLNLTSMYELLAGPPGDAKRRLKSWIIRVAPDDFTNIA